MNVPVPWGSYPWPAGTCAPFSQRRAASACSPSGSSPPAWSWSSSRVESRSPTAGSCPGPWFQSCTWKRFVKWVEEVERVSMECDSCPGFITSSSPLCPDWWSEATSHFCDITKDLPLKMVKIVHTLSEHVKPSFCWVSAARCFTESLHVSVAAFHFCNVHYACSCFYPQAVAKLHMRRGDFSCFAWILFDPSRAELWNLCKTEIMQFCALFSDNNNTYTLELYLTITLFTERTPSQYNVV